MEVHPSDTTIDFLRTRLTKASLISLRPRGSPLWASALRGRSLYVTLFLRSSCVYTSALLPTSTATQSQRPLLFRLAAGLLRMAAFFRGGALFIGFFVGPFIGPFIGLFLSLKEPFCTCWLL